jgi:hypothetical protein
LRLPGCFQKLERLDDPGQTEGRRFFEAPFFASLPEAFGNPGSLVFWTSGFGM